MEMTHEQKVKAATTLSSKGITQNCSSCKTTGSLEIKTRLMRVSSFDDTGDRLPFVLLSCKNCGHSLLFRADVLGVIPPAA